MHTTDGSFPEPIMPPVFSRPWSGLAVPVVVHLALVVQLLVAVTPVGAQTSVTDPEPAIPFRAPPSEVVTARRHHLLDSIGSGIVLVRSAAAKSIEGDYPQDSDFRQNNEFFYLTGLETPDSWLLLIAGENGSRRETLFIPERNPQQERWTGPKPSFEDAASATGIGDVRATEDFEEALVTAVFRRPEAGTVFAPLNPQTRELPIVQRLLFELPATVNDVEPAIAELRLVKDDFEIEMLRHTIETTAAAHREAMRAARPGMYEYELEALVEYTFRRLGAERVGFPSIIGSGPNSVVLHYDKNRRRMEAGDLVVMDIGAEYSYYSADVTRTIPVSGRFTDRQKKIYNLVLQTQLAAIEAVRPGATMRDVTNAARNYMREHSGDLCGRRTCDAFFVHGVGHWLGMDVHDVGSYATPFAPGMVITVEPGIYLPDEDLGVRIEDDVLVTATGQTVLSDGAPREVEEIEALMTAR